MKKLNVVLRSGSENDRLVGTLAEAEGSTFFEYNPTYLSEGFSLSPFRLPFQDGLFEHKDHAFGPLPGLFDDSLPDGWGLLLMDRYLQRLGHTLSEVSPLDRLSYLGSRTMGALVYEPSNEPDIDTSTFELHNLAEQSQKVLSGHETVVLDKLFKTGGSPGGARPKILVGYASETGQVISGEGELNPEYEHWIVKFSGKSDGAMAGRTEFAYSLMAKAAGISMPATRLFKTHEGDQFFGIKRFDRKGKSRIHIHTFGNLIHLNFRIPSADYGDLLKVTTLLTRNHQDVEEAFRRMVFNLMTHNRDDHVKNFSFLLDTENGEWSLSPAYDLTFSEGPGGEHSMTIANEGKNPGREHIGQIAEEYEIKKRRADSLTEKVRTAVTSWPEHAQKAGIPEEQADKLFSRFLLELE